MVAIKVFDRRTKEYYTEKEYKAGSLKFLYGTAPGRFILNHIVVRPRFSRFVRIYYDSPLSAWKIDRFIKEYNINMDEYSDERFGSFNDFFKRRKLSVQKTDDREILIAPCDGKLSIYRISDDLKLRIKGTTYRIREILGDAGDITDFKGGLCLVFRLTADDCHRYIYFDSGHYVQGTKIPGILHTVRDYSGRYRVYKANKRDVSILETEHFGTAAYIEVGALLVGQINNRGTCSFERYEEKGNFEYGGSTVIVLLSDSANVKIDEDLLRNSSMNIEVKVSMGERLGKRECTVYDRNH